MDRLIEESARLNENIQTFTSNRLHITKIFRTFTNA